MVIDTGSTVTMMNQQTWNRLKRTGMWLKKTTMRLFTVDGTETRSYGNQTFPIKVRGMELRQRMEVTDCEDDIVLGMDFINNFVKVIDIENLQLHIGAVKVPINLYEESTPLIRVIAARDTTIPARSEMVLDGSTDHWRTIEGVVEMDQQPTEKRPWLIARTLVKIEGGRAPVRVINVLPEPVNIKAGAHLAVIQVLNAETKVIPFQKKIRQVTKSRTTDQWKNYQQLKELSTSAGREMQPWQQEEVQNLLIENKESFSNDKGTLGHTTLVKHDISTGDHRPVKQAPRRIPIHHRPAVDEAVADMLEKGIIEESTSPWASPIVLVKKKDGSLRFCVDYRKLNMLTEKDAYPLPRIDDTLSAFQGAEWFSTLDLTSGYWQVELTEEAKKKSAFCIPGGLYQFRVMSFGLCNAPATFERLMEQVLAGLSWKTCLLYLDDIIVYSKTFREHTERLQEIFTRLHQAGLKLKPSKCHLYQREVSFLGHIVSRDGIRADPAKTDAVQTWDHPQNITDVRSFLGLCSYYRRFVKGFSKIAAPLTRLNEKGVPFQWKEEQQDAFQELKDRLTSPPILGYPQLEGRYILDTDASDTGIGAVLSQEQYGEERVIMYLSRSLTKEERRYCVTRKELLAVVYAVGQSRQYLLGKKFLIRSDHGSLAWLMNFKDPQGQVARWIELLSEYDFQIQHRPGRKHQNADGLSRTPCPQCGRSDWKQLKLEAWKDLEIARKAKQLQDPVPEPTPSKGASETFCWMQQYTKEEIADLQRQEPWYKVVQAALDKDSTEKIEYSALGTDEKILFNMRKQLFWEDGVLYRRWKYDEETDKIQLIVPTKIRPELFRLAHEEKTGGHLGARKMLHRIRRRYFWPQMKVEIKENILKCDKCATRSNASPKKNKMQKYQVGRPMERVAMDILGPFHRSTRGNTYVLIVGDYFTKWIEAYPIPNQDAKTVADKLTLEFIARYGAPLEIHTDQGRNFESQIIKNVCKILGIHKTRTTAFRPQSDGFVERFNRTLEQMLRMYVNNKQTNWDEMVPLALTAYRATRQETTGQTPNKLMLGRETNLPVDLLVGSPPGEKEQEVTEYGAQLRINMEKVFQMVRKKTSREMDRQKRLYDRGKTDNSYKVGDLVWEAIKARQKGKSPKLQRKWRGPGIVLEKYTDVTYLVAYEKTQKVVHFDVLKPYRGTRRPRWLREKQRQLEQRTKGALGVQKKVREMGSSSSGSDGDSTESE